MCLKSVDEPTKYKRRRIGYKVMLQDLLTKRLKSQYFDTNYIMEAGKTYTDTKKGMITDGFPRVSYPAGYHIYLDRNEAVRKARQHGLNCVTVEVRFKDVVASGLQDETAVVVARQITILKVLQ